MRSVLVPLLALLAAHAALPAQSDFVNFESALIHPIRVSADGQRLYVLNTPDQRLAVFSLADPDRPRLMREIPVGLEPVSLTERTADEVWVVDNLSDTVSVVSVSQGRVLDFIRVKDEPADVAFAGGNAFVSVSGSDEVHVFDAVTRRRKAKLAVFGKDPRAMVASAGGDRVYVLIHRSGNQTAIRPVEVAPRPPAPENDELPPAPRQSSVVSLREPGYEKFRSMVPDYDVIEIDSRSLRVVRQLSGAGTINFDLALDPASGDLLVANIESRNDVKFEPVLKGHAIDSRVTRIGLSASPATKTFIDLNPGVDYGVLPNPSAKSRALAEPTSIAVARDGSRIYVTAQGTDRIGVLDAQGRVLHRIDVGEARGAEVATRRTRGPRSLAMHPRAERLYVLNRFSHTVSVVDTRANVIVREQSIGLDPTPELVKVGRRFLYDAKLSGNGTMSCASCHIDGDIDLLVWDLGDPGGKLVDIPREDLIFDLGTKQNYHHPMKGPMVTQSLRGLSDLAALHWRGDRANAHAFNPAFGTLLGGEPLAAEDMNAFADFLMAIAYPPNPNQTLARTLPETPADCNAAEGRRLFESARIFEFASTGQKVHCKTCHANDAGSNDKLLPPPPFFSIVLQPARVGVLRNLYRREGASLTGQSKVAFGYLHDGRYPSLETLLGDAVFSDIPADKVDDLAQFLRSFDTGTAPAVGHRLRIGGDGAESGALADEWRTLEHQVELGHCDLIARGTLDGLDRGFFFDPDLKTWLADDPAVGPFLSEELLAMAREGRAELVVTGVPAGSGERMAIDRDRNGRLDGLDGVRSFGPVEAGAPRLCVTGTPRPGAELAMTAAASRGAKALLAIALTGRRDDVLVAPMPVDGSGTAALLADVPRHPALHDASFDLRSVVVRDGRSRLSNGVRVRLD